MTGMMTKEIVNNYDHANDDADDDADDHDRDFRHTI